MIPGPKFLLAAFALLTLSTACSLSQPPRIKDAIIPPMAVQDPLFKRSTGKIFLLPEGIWTFVPDSAENTLENMQPGDLLAFETFDDTSLSDEQHPRHIFAIVTKRSWGFLLQRLDSHPINPNAQGSLAPLPNKPSDDICFGTTNESTHNTLTNPCLTQNPLARFDIYATTPQNQLLIQNQPESNTLAMPITRQALLYTDAQNTPKLFTPPNQPNQFPDHWIAIRATQTALTPDHISIVSDTSCPSIEPNAALSGLTIHHIHTNETLPTTTHPLNVEAAAFQHGADTLLWCAPNAQNNPNASETTTATPAIHHPLLITRGKYILGSSTLGLRPVQISATPTQRALLAQISALSARAHFELADFALETLLQSQPTTPQSIRQLAIQAMQLTASAGRPEAALRQGWFATRDTWNRDGDPLYMLGQAAAFAAFDLNVEYSKLIHRFSETLKSANDTNLVAWLIYDDFRRQIAAGTQIPLLEFEAIERNLVTRKLDTWALTIRALAIQHELQNQNAVKPAAIEILQKAFADRNLAPIWSAYHPQSPTQPLTCPQTSTSQPNTPCTLDSFGRRLTQIRAENPEYLITQLRQTPRVDLRTNFHTEALDLAKISTQPSTQARLLLAAFPLLSAPDKSTALPLISQSLANTLKNAPQDDCTDLAQIQALGHELLLRATGPNVSPTEQATARNAAWLANHAYPAACHSIAQFEETTLKYLQQSAAQNNLVVPFFDSLLARNNLSTTNVSTQNTNPARTLARLTTKLGNNEPCRRYNLALAAALARAGQLELAQNHLLLSGQCSQSKNTFYTQSHNLILNYIAYERSGSWPNNQPPKTTDPQQNHCIAFEPQAFDILRFLEPDIAQLAAQFQLPAPSTTPEFLQLRLSSAAIAQGEAAYQVARRTLAEGRPKIAANLLAEARADFTSSSHFPGIARIDFLENTLFNNDLTAFEQTAQAPKINTQNLLKTPATTLPAIFRAGHARNWLEQFDTTSPTQRPEIPSHLLITASLLVEEPAQTQNRLRSIPENTQTTPLKQLCQPTTANSRLLQ